MCSGPYPRIPVVLVAVLCAVAPAMAAEPKDELPGVESSPAYLNESFQTPLAVPVPPSPVPGNRYSLYRNMLNPVADGAESVAKGRLLYGAHCKVCHGVEGKNPVADLSPAPVDLSSRSFQVARRDGELFFVIRNGIPDSAMLPWGGRLSDRDIWMLVRYLRTLEPKGP